MTLRTVLAGYLVAIPMGLLAIGWTVVCIGRGEFLTAVVTAGLGAASFAMTVPPALSLAGRITPRGFCDGEGTTFRPDLIFEIAVRVMVLGLVFACTLFAIFNPLGRLDIPVPQSARYSIPFMAGALTLMGFPVIWLMIRRGGTKYLRLTPAGYEVAEGYRPECGGWDEVADVTDVVPESYRQVPNALVLMKTDGTAAVLAAGPITPGGQDLRELVRFYWREPQCRSELMDGRAIERLAERRFKADT
ncbi:MULTISPECIES: hypothetical protein [unclassified Mycolicibacterium]|uniref:hypothetical protein n=1 Tax=unclassified Mycolicibacterium TaxID=2636767 RepID=UPI0012DEC44F|nr:MULTISPECIES: hypothetical protein [unclassified Mycolicibacterium]MUL83855.1 hypothetical protein [Mycolicibacterium sp. CBMA 329]MUL90079.1 hypothetical protein [Mycolicibacterium sp. CBMA 331]MUL97901.1 hypothetical protein [Mycolicibacterium sp. CBMA 334]MUM28060.1 hypothetical protein [Mycolicibacterium sp. CBMA 295]MUM39594.1 hypothetical protein [Mycolicibacterium sp. CBMA 247]